MASDDINARADIPASLHPDVMLPFAAALDREGTIGREAYASGRAALTEMRRAYAAIHDAERAVQASAPPAARAQSPSGDDLRLGPRGAVVRRTGREAELAAAAGRAFDRTARVVDQRVKELRAHGDALAGRVAAALADPRAAAPDGVALAQEIRSHIKSLPQGERLGFLVGAIASDDRRTASAALSAPPYLSGISAAAAVTVREHAARRWAAVEHEQGIAVAKAIDRIMAGSTTLVGRYADVLKRADGAAARASAAIGRLADG